MMNIQSIQTHIDWDWGPKSKTEVSAENSEGDTKVSANKESDISRTKLKSDELVLKPTPITLEDRKKQVMSETDLKNLLSILVRIPVETETKSNRIDVRG